MIRERLQILGLTAGYGNRPPIVCDLDLEAAEGTVTTIIGPNGAGKSTLLKAVAGLVRTSTGSIRVGERDVSRLDAVGRARAGVGLCAQGRTNFGHMTVEENLRLACFRLNRREVRARLVRLHETDEFLRERWGDRVGNLSGGQQQYVEISMALATDPSVLLLDEPSLGLSPSARRSVFDRARAVAGEGATVVIVEQNVKDALRVSDRVVVLNAGRVALEGPPSRVLDDARLRDVYLGTHATSARPATGTDERSLE